MNLLVLSTWFPYPPGNGSRIRAYFLLRELVRAGHNIRLVAGLQNDITPQDKDAGIAALREMGIGEVVTVPWEWLGEKDKTKRGLWSLLRAAFSQTPRAVLDTRNPALSQTVAAQIARPETDAVLVMETGMDAYLPKHLPPDLPLILDGAEVAVWAVLDAEAMLYPARADRPLQFARRERRAGFMVRKARRYWQKRFARYRVVTAVSEIEAAALRGLLLESRSGPKIAVVPNGVDTAAYAPRDWSAVVSGRLIFNGSVTYDPNHYAVRSFGRDILPLVRKAVPEAILQVTGSCSPDTYKSYPGGRSKTVQFTGFVSDLRPQLSQAAVCVVPLGSRRIGNTLYGGGTRLKILEAWAAGVPVVSTKDGAKGFDGAVPGTHYLQIDVTTHLDTEGVHPIKVVDEAVLENFAQATVRLLTEPDLAQSLSENARALVVERYDWSRFGTQLSDLLMETCRASTPSL